MIRRTEQRLAFRRIFVSFENHFRTLGVYIGVTPTGLAIVQRQRARIAAGVNVGYFPVIFFFFFSGGLVFRSHTLRNVFMSEVTV